MNLDCKGEGDSAKFGFDGKICHDSKLDDWRMK
jgi:hypothetical protein